MKNHDVTKTKISTKKVMLFLSFASVTYVLFVTGTENFARARAVSELWRREKSGAFNALHQQVAG